MHETEHRSVDEPDETGAFPHGRVEMLRIVGGGAR